MSDDRVPVGGIADINLLPWRPEHETVEGRLVTPEEFLSVLSWGSAATARVILEEGYTSMRRSPETDPAASEARP